MIVLEEFDILDSMLEFTKVDSSMNNKKWRTWKEIHVVSITVWSVLLCLILAAYFAKCLTNKGKLKRAGEFQKKFPKVLHFF